MGKDSPVSENTPSVTDRNSIESREFAVYEPHSSPDGMKVLMADEAEAFEKARAQILQLFRGQGYRLIDPPILDSIESLFSTASAEVQQKTMRAIDPEDARPLGIRTDITPQIARLDARQMDHTMPQRYAYCGCVIHGRRDHIGAWRNPHQIGVELFGADNLNADLEIIRLAVDTCRLMSLEELVLDIGHLGIFESLFALTGLHTSLRHPLFALMQTKSQRAVDDFLLSYETSTETRKLLVESVRLYGGTEMLEQARRLFASFPDIMAKLEYVTQVHTQLLPLKSIAKISFDLVNSNSYSYERGLVFVLYSPQTRHELIRGGRYNDIGDTFGRPRSAVGFSGYLHELLACHSHQSCQCIYAPYCPGDQQLIEAIERLRGEGHMVICGLEAEHNHKSMGCEHELVKENQQWQVKAISTDKSNGSGS